MKDNSIQVNIKNHYNAIDGLRTYSAIGIVAMHVLANGNFNLGGFIFEKMIPSFTNLVFLFMVISAFSMCCGYYEKVISGKISIDKFYGKRYAKVWPFFALLCALELILFPSKNALYETFANLTLCFGFLPYHDINVIGVGWFLGLVFVFYLIFPFFSYLLLDKKRAWISFIVALIFNYLCDVRFNAERTNIIYCAVFFLTGGLIYLYKEQLSKMLEKYQFVCGLIIVIFVGIYYMFSTSVFVMILLFGFMLIYTLNTLKKYRILFNPITKFISEISMEIYLSHMIVFQVIKRLGVLNLLKTNIVLSYIVVTVMTFIGTIIFVILVKQIVIVVKKIRFKYFGR